MLCPSCSQAFTDADACPHCGGPAWLADRYALQEVLGHGAAGTTYRARDRELGQEVAIKELLVRKVASAKALELFEREAAVLAQLSHPGIPRFLETLQVDTERHVALYLVQELIAGRTLAAEAEGHRYTEAEVFAVVAEVLEILAYLGGLSPPVVHRDVKPANIMRRDADGRLVLIDFGAVRAALDTAAGGSTVAGTFGFMAPEQLMGRALPATDLYGLGATAVALLSRQDPTQLQGLDRQIDLSALGLGAPGHAQVLRAMLAQDPAARPQDAAALARRLRGETDETSAALVSSARAATDLALVPAPPRPLPAAFTKHHGAGVYLQLLFGGLFGGIGVGVGLLNSLIGLLARNPRLIELSLLLGVFFGGVGGLVLLTGAGLRARLTQAFQHGRSASGEIVQVERTAYTVHRQNAYRYGYRFQVEGTTRYGTLTSVESLDLAPGDPVIVLYEPDRPERSTLWLGARDDRDARPRKG